MLTDDVILFRRPLELYNLTTGETLGKYKTLDDVLSIEIDDKTVADIINGWEHLPPTSFNGGGGSSSGMDAYTHRGIPMGGGAGGGAGSNDFPARFNGLNRNGEASFEKTLDNFRSAHVNDNYESGITVDAQGFTTQYVHGGASSVSIGGSKGEITIHNHPSDGWPIFSGADLVSTASLREAGVVASSSRKGRGSDTAKYAGDYIFTKSQNFKATEFIKGVKTANLKGKDYNDAVDKWLKANQKKYGYVYTYRPSKD